MAFIKRKEGFSDFVVSKHQNVNSQKGQNVNPSIEKKETVNQNVKKLDVSTSHFTPLPKKNVPVVCHWVEHLHWQVYINGNHDNFRKLLTYFGEKASQVQWISVRYRCLLECVLNISEMKTIQWNDVAELTNGFTFLIESTWYKELPDNYPYTKKIVELRDNLKSFCLNSYGEGENSVQLRLQFETKQLLMLQRCELSVFQKMTFNQFQQEIDAEKEIQIKKVQEEKARQKKTEKDKIRDARWQEIKRKMKEI
ncbi:MAG: hypothetical protein NT150_13880 [Bacteroidetes bacterium]|nr:hypothetical protein [Bacteroidota bacterium]